MMRKQLHHSLSICSTPLTFYLQYSTHSPFAVHHSLSICSTRLREGVSKAASSLCVRRAGKLFDCPRVLKSRFNAYVLSSFQHCAPCGCCQRSLIRNWQIALFEMQKGFMNGELCCFGHRGKVSVLCLLYKIYHRVNHPKNEHQTMRSFCCSS